MRRIWSADATLVVTPFHLKLSSKDVYEHYRAAVLESVDLPMVIYNVSKFTGFRLDPKWFFNLPRNMTVSSGIKDSGGSMIQIIETIHLVGDKISVLA